MARRTSLVSVVLASAVGIVALRLAATAFLPTPQPRVIAAVGASVLGAAAPAFAEEAAEAAAAAAPAAAEAAKAAEEGGFLNLGRIPLGGGFAINLDIPESGIVNLVILIAGLFYLLGPILSESMSTREKEIQQDIDDAIAKYEEATSRLAEAEKNAAQAAEVVAEIEASIEKDKKEFLATITASTEATIKEQDKASEAAIAKMGDGADKKLENYINQEATMRGAREVKLAAAEKKAAFLQKGIDLL